MKITILCSRPNRKGELADGEQEEVLRLTLAVLQQRILHGNGGQSNDSKAENRNEIRFLATDSIEYEVKNDVGKDFHAGGNGKRD